MTWPPPTVPPQPPSPELARRQSARPVAAWLAATGGALVLVAAVVVVAGSWQDISPLLKLGVLVTATVLLGAAAERSRDVVPATARAVAHLAAALAAPVGIAAAAGLGATWPGCVVAGGILGAVVCEVQARRWRAPLLEMTCVIAIGLALVGLAALVPVPVGVLAAIAAGAFLVLRRDGAAAALAAAAAASPLLVTLAEQRLGEGTLARIGATGEVLAWSAPLAGALAGGVLAVVAGRRNAPAVAVLALAAPIVGVATGLATRGVDAVLWLCLPPLVLAALELVVAVARAEPWNRVARPIADGLAASGAIVAAVLPALAVAEHARTGDVPMLPLLLGAAALAATVVRTGRGGGPVGGLALAGAGSTLVAVVAGLGWSPVVVAGAAVAVAMATAAIGRGRWLPVAPTMATAAGLLLDTDGPLLAEAALASVLLVLAVDLVCRRRPDRTTIDIPLVATTFVGAALVASADGRHANALYLVGLAAAVTTVAVRSHVRAPALLLPVACAAAVVTAGALPDDAPVDAWAGAGIAALAIAAAVTWRRSQELWTVHLAAVLGVAALPFGLLAIGAAGAQITLALLIVAVVLTGTSFLIVTSGPLATAAMAASALAAVVAPADVAVLASIAIAALGIQVALEGSVRSVPRAVRLGHALAVAGGVSTWWSSGADDAVARWLAPHGVTSGDVGTAVVSVLLLAAGAYAGRARAVSSWVTAAPGLGLLAVWLLDAQLQRSVGWSVPLALATGVAAVAVGGWRRLAAPLVIGTGTLAATVVVSAGPRLSELDSWVWLAAGGLGLIAVAVLVERTVGADRAPVDWRRLCSTWR